MKTENDKEPVVFCRYTEMRPVVTLVEHPLNPNKHPDGQLERLAEVIRGNGWRQPITVSDRSGYIVKGHGRYLAAKKAGLAEVPVEVQHYENEAAEMADMLADNRIAELAEMDMGALNDALSALQVEDPAALPLSGYTEQEWAELRAGLDDLQAGTETETDLDDVPEVDEAAEPVTKSGDVWHLGQHRLLCGDSTLPSSYAELLRGEEADMMVTDPPYNVNLGNGGSADEARKRHRRTDGLCIANDHMSDGDFYTFLGAFYAATLAVLKPGSAFYIWHADNEGLNFRKALKDAGGVLRQTIIWNKNTITLGRQDYQWKHEPCLYGWKEGASHRWFSDRCQSTVIDMPKPARSELHPTMKPVALFEYLIGCSSQPGDVVLDPFGGSGTTAVACEHTGRVARLVELDGRYCDAIVRRFQGAFPGVKVWLEREGMDHGNPLAE